MQTRYAAWVAGGPCHFGRGRKGALWARPCSLTLVLVEPEALISREELTATLFAIADIREDVYEIRQLLKEEDDGEAPETDS